MDTPATLLDRLRRPDDPAAWGRFVELYTPLIYGWARRTGLQEADAADLVQEVLTLLYRKLPEFAYDGRRSFRGWLRTVTLNKWREGHRRRVPVPAGGGAALDDVAVPDESAAFAEAEYRAHLVRHALAHLEPEFPPSTWRAFREYVIAGRPAEQVAADLGLRIGTVYAAKSRVLTRLRRELEGMWE